MRTSPYGLIFAAIGCVTFFTLQYLTATQPTSTFGTIVNSLGALYGVLLFATGFYSVHYALRTALSRANLSNHRKSIRRSMIPATIGAIGVVHGYLSVIIQYVSLPDGAMDLAHYPIFHSTIWATLFVSGMFTMMSLSIIAVGRVSSLEQDGAFSQS